LIISKHDVWCIQHVNNESGQLIIQLNFKIRKRATVENPELSKEDLIKLLLSMQSYVRAYVLVNNLVVNVDLIEIEIFRKIGPLSNAKTSFHSAVYPKRSILFSSTRYLPS